MSDQDPNGDHLELDGASMLMKVVQVAECVPARQARTGAKITMLTLWYDGEIEHPLMLDLKDTRRLMKDLLVSLATHGDATADEIIDKYFAAP